MPSSGKVPAIGTQLSPELAARILGEVRSRKEEWLGYLERLTLNESPSTEPESQLHVLDLIGWSLEELGLRVRRIPGRTTGGAILARPPGRRGAPAQLLLGHTDTVWPRGTLDEMPLQQEGSIVRGPGVFDMKAGLTQIVFALRALDRLELEPEVSPVVFVNSDEEIGSPESTQHVRRLARAVCRAFVLEPALGVEGRLKTARKGTGHFSIRVIGRGAHSGLDPERGASAIQELSMVIQTLHALTDPEEGIVVNVGQIQGGVRPNVVAASASAEVDIRVNTLEQARWIEERVRGLEPFVPGCTIQIEGDVRRPPLERTPGNRQLWEQARALGKLLGVPLDEGRAGGASDGNTTSVYTPTLDGLGAVGDGAHASHEYVEVDRSLERCALLACLLLLPPSPSGKAE